MQIALSDAAGLPAQPFPSGEFAAIVRPWAVLAWVAAAYMTYTAFDSLPGLVRHSLRTTESSAVTPARAPQVASKQFLMVTKCIQDDVTTYSDGDCAPGARAERILLPTEPAPAPAPAVRPVADSAATMRQQVCQDIEAQARRIAEKASHVPSGAEHAWLEARRTEARNEQLRLGC